MRTFSVAHHEDQDKPLPNAAEQATSACTPTVNPHCSRPAAAPHAASGQSVGGSGGSLPDNPNHDCGYYGA